MPTQHLPRLVRGALLCYSGRVLDARESPPAEDAAWDAFVAGHPCGHLLQASAWGRFRADWGWKVRRVVVVGADGGICSGAQVLVRRTVGGALGYVPRGPVCDPRDPAWPVLHQALRRLARASCVALRIEPHWPDEAATRQRLRAAGWHECAPVQPPSTVRVDLGASEDELLAAMHPKWRYNIRLAARHGVRVRDGSVPDLPRFERLVAETAARQGFPSRPPGYYAAAWRSFGPAAAHLYMAELARPAPAPDSTVAPADPAGTSGVDLLGAILVFHFGDTATYLYGGSAAGGRAHMPNHLLQWQAMRRARAEGRRWYDFWGIPDEVGRAVVAGGTPEELPPGHGGLWGVWRFKRGFGGDVFRTIGAWEEVYSPLRYAAGSTLLSWLRRLSRPARR